MNAVSSGIKDNSAKMPAQDPNERASETTRLDDNERLRRANPYEVSRTTCSTEAADYAYRHFPSPMTIEWRAASAGYDEGVAKGAVEGLNRASEMSHYIDRLEGDMITQDQRIKGLEKGLRAAEAVIQGVWDARAMGVDQKAQDRYAEARAVVDRYWEENPTIPESSVVEDVPVGDIADWPTLATGPIEPDTKQWDPESDVAWLKEQLLLLQETVQRLRALGAESAAERDERERLVTEDAYRRGVPVSDEPDVPVPWPSGGYGGLGIPSCPACGYSCGCCCQCSCQTLCPTHENGYCDCFEDCHGGHEPWDCEHWATRYNWAHAKSARIYAQTLGRG